MKIGIIGSGDVGRRLASGLIGLEHSVTIGTRNPDKPELVEWAKSSSGNDSGNTDSKAFIGTFEKAASFGDLIILSTLWDGTENAINMAGLQNLGEKVVIDTTNPLDFSKGTPPSLSVGHTDSAGEKIQRLLPSSKVVKAFNTVGNPHMVHPDFPNGPPTMFICGNDDDAKKMVIDTILTPFGWDSADIGSIRESRLLESLAMLWVTHYFRTGTGNHAFKLLRK